MKPNVVSRRATWLLLVILGMLALTLGIPAGWANPLPLGACCFTDCHCELLSEQGCADLGGLWDGTPYCVPSPCDCPQPVGACCAPDGSCTVVQVMDCSWGVFFPYIWCDPNPCPPCKRCDGPCCLANGSCQMLFEVDCQEQGGLWLGGAELCTPDPCATSSAPDDDPDPSNPGSDPQSWGRIKNLYREKTR